MAYPIGAVGFATLSLLLGPTFSRSQLGQPAPAARTSVTVVLKERFTYSTRLAAVLQRNPGSDGLDIIALKRSAATPELLATLVGTLIQLRTQQGDAPAEKTTVVVYDGRKHRPLSSEERARMEDVIARLVAAPSQAVPGAGNVPAVRVDLTR